MGDNDELSLLLLYKGGDVLKAELEDGGGGGACCLVTCCGGGGLGLKSSDLGVLGLRLVLYQQLEQLGCLVLVEGLLELVDGGGDL